MYIAEYEVYIGLYKVYIGSIEGVHKMYIVVYKVCRDMKRIIVVYKCI